MAATKCRSGAVQSTDLVADNPLVVTGLSQQAVSRLSRQAAGVVRAAVFTVIMTLGLTVKIGGWALPVVVAVAGAAWALLRTALYRTATGWTAQMPVWAARPYCPGLRSDLRETAELIGHLAPGAGGLRWTPTAGAKRLGADEVVWPLSAHAWTCRQGRLGLPLTYLRLTDQAGVSSDLWVRADPDEVRRAVGANSLA